LDHGVKKFMVEKSGVEMSSLLKVKRHFKPGLFNHVLFNPMVQKSLLKSSGLKTSRLKSLGLKGPGLNLAVEKFGF
jgi:hypothetical protein